MSLIRRIPTNYPTEVALRQAALEALRPHFVVYEEVKGRHWTGKNLRIDAVLRPHDPSEWFDPQPVFGVEFKQPRGSFDTRDYTAWAAQAVSYTNTNWQTGGRMLVFACPSPFEGLSRLGGERTVSLVSRLLGQLGVGELVRLHRHGWSLVLSGHILWSETEGVKDAARWSLVPKDGSR